MLNDLYDVRFKDKACELFNNARTGAYAKAMGLRSISQKCGCPTVGQIALDPGPYTYPAEPVEYGEPEVVEEEVEEVEIQLVKNEDCEGDGDNGIETNEFGKVLSVPEEIEVEVIEPEPEPEPETYIPPDPSWGIHPSSLCEIIPLTGDKCDDATAFSIAPWWDECHPCSYDFVGPILMDVGGWESTYNRQIFDRANGGSAFGTNKRRGRCLTFDFYLVATSECGLEYALSYYDSLFDTLGECGYFSLYSAKCCPPPDLQEEEYSDYIRHIRQVTATNGPQVTETKKIGRGPDWLTTHTNTHYMRVQFTLCSEDAWIYEEPEVCTSGTLSALDCRPGKQCPTPRAKYEVREFEFERQKYPIKLGACGDVCQVGDWDWNETQLQGGDGVLTIVGFIEQEKEDCKPYQVILAYDKYTGQTKFQTVGWSMTDIDGDLPCDCPIEISSVYVRNDDFDPELEVCDGNEPFILDTAPGGAGCCFVDLNFTENSCGFWAPIDGCDDRDDIWPLVVEDPECLNLEPIPSDCEDGPCLTRCEEQSILPDGSSGGLVKGLCVGDTGVMIYWYETTGAAGPEDIPKVKPHPDNSLCFIPDEGGACVGCLCDAYGDDPTPQPNCEGGVCLTLEEDVALMGGTGTVLRGDDGTILGILESTSPTQPADAELSAEGFYVTIIGQDCIGVICDQITVCGGCYPEGACFACGNAGIFFPVTDNSLNPDPVAGCDHDIPLLHQGGGACWRATRTNDPADGHDGVDFPCKYGSDIVAVEDGNVTFAQINGDPGGYGTYIVIDHGSYCSLYGHLAGIDSNVQAGSFVTAGQVIGTCGNSGNAGLSGGNDDASFLNNSYSFYPENHVHFEIQSPCGGGNDVDPIGFFPCTACDESVLTGGGNNSPCSGSPCAQVVENYDLGSDTGTVLLDSTGGLIGVISTVNGTVLPDLIGPDSGNCYTNLNGDCIACECGSGTLPAGWCDDPNDIFIVCSGLGGPTTVAGMFAAQGLTCQDYCAIAAQNCNDYSQAEVVQIIRDIMGPEMSPTQLDNMIDLAWCESGWDACAIRCTAPEDLETSAFSPEGSAGVFQVNMCAHYGASINGTGQTVSVETMMNPFLNITYALQLFKQTGSSPYSDWLCSACKLGLITSGCPTDMCGSQLCCGLGTCVVPAIPASLNVVEEDITDEVLFSPPQLPEINVAGTLSLTDALIECNGSNLACSGCVVILPDPADGVIRVFDMTTQMDVGLRSDFSLISGGTELVNNATSEVYTICPDRTIEQQIETACVQNDLICSNCVVVLNDGGTQALYNVDTTAFIDFLSEFTFDVGTGVYQLNSDPSVTYDACVPQEPVTSAQAEAFCEDNNYECGDCVIAMPHPDSGIPVIYNTGNSTYLGPLSGNFILSSDGTEIISTISGLTYTVCPLENPVTSAQAEAFCEDNNYECGDCVIAMPHPDSGIPVIYDTGTNTYLGPLSGNFTLSADGTELTSTLSGVTYTVCPLNTIIDPVGDIEGCEDVDCWLLASEDGEDIVFNSVRNISHPLCDTTNGSFPSSIDDNGLVNIHKLGTRFAESGEAVDYFAVYNFCGVRIGTLTDCDQLSFSNCWELSDDSISLNDLIPGMAGNPQIIETGLFANEVAVIQEVLTVAPAPCACIIDGVVYFNGEDVGNICSLDGDGNCVEEPTATPSEPEVADVDDFNLNDFCEEDSIYSFPPSHCTLLVKNCDCEEKEKCKTVKDCEITIRGGGGKFLWKFLDPENDSNGCYGEFPDPFCNYIFPDNFQDNDKICRPAEVLIERPKCAVIEEEKIDIPQVLFPLFDIGSCEEACFDTVALPNLQEDPARKCYEVPSQTKQACCTYTNASTVYGITNHFKMNTGSDPLRNFRIKIWEATEGEPTPCEAEVSANENYDAQQCLIRRCVYKAGLFLNNDGYIEDSHLSDISKQFFYSDYMNCLWKAGIIPEVGTIWPDPNNNQAVTGFYRLVIDGPIFPLPLTPACISLGGCEPIVGDPCEEVGGGVYCDKEPVWCLEVPYLPENTTLNIDGETCRQTLQIGDDIDNCKFTSASPYMSGECGTSFENFEGKPCTTYHALIEFDCEGSAVDATYELSFVKRYSASGTMKGGGTENGAGAAGGGAGFGF